MSKIKILKLSFLLIILEFQTIYSQNPVVKSINSTGIEIYKLLPENKNLFISPLSLNSALAMTYEGAKEKTEMAFNKFMSIENKKLFTDKYLNFNQNLNELGNIELTQANAVWVQKKYEIEPEYINILNKNFEAGFKHVDFKNTRKREKTRTQINSWVARKTNQKIKDLLKKDMLKKGTRMVLTNAIYFKSAWDQNFKESATRKDSFFTTKTNTTQADFMNKTMRLRYRETNSYQVVELPYKGNDAAMYIFLPKFIEGLSTVEKELNTDILHSFEENSAYETVELSIPKFKIEYETELSDVLKKSALEVAFTNDANFSGINKNNELKISKIIHKAFINVDEQGTEAAAATAVVLMRKTSVGSFNPKIFKANHPFFFLITEKRHNSILFMGRVVNP